MYRTDLQTSGVHDGDLDVLLLQVEVNQVAESQDRAGLVTDFEVPNQLLNLMKYQ